MTNRPDPSAPREQQSGQDEAARDRRGADGPRRSPEEEARFGGDPGMTPIDHPYGGRGDTSEEAEETEQQPGEWESDDDVVEERSDRPYGNA
ncbi:hypothetical protein HDA32_003652 [Spinactinospora alkalitolerans]|uniref:Uncharacterized protein n=1 Tax=Spinactinospora alkalitolerans TaxID=687207 RepID=A0A852TZP5_9ACTN|nr:hypothetical protein [Spinactinospora alkalitolerans]NYE48532.1 hypothetical protein [Spinactinospora alkalitolerans]